MSVTIENETEYSLSATVLNQIERDALEYFGDYVNRIRIQYGIERHAFNARTGEVRYAFSPGDFGLVDAPTTFTDSTSRADDVPSIDDDREEIQDNVFDGEADSDDEDTTNFASLDDDLDVTTDDEGPKFQSLDTDFESLEDAERNFLYNEDYDS